MQRIIESMDLKNGKKLVGENIRENRPLRA